MVLLRVARLKMVLVIRRPCSAQVWRSSRPLLLQLPTPCIPITPSQETPSQPTLALKSPIMMSFISIGYSGDGSVQVFIELVLGLIWVSHGGGIGADNGGELLSMGKGESHGH